MTDGGYTMTPTEVNTHETALAVATPLTPAPLYRGAAMVEAWTAYRDLQVSLDKAMPDQLMTLDGKPFRKKGYWRAVSVAFNLSVEPVAEERRVLGTLDDGTE